MFTVINEKPSSCMKNFQNRLAQQCFLLLSRLPLSVLYVFSTACYGIMYYAIGYRKKAIAGNLKRSFPKKTDEELQRIHKRFMKHFCDQMFETIKALTISEKELKKRFRIRNPEVVNAFYSQNRSVLLFAAHYGNWEWFISMPFYFKHQPLSLYQQLSSELMDFMMKYCRERTGVVAAESAKGYKTIADYAAKGIPTISLIIGDQSPTRKSAKHWVQFLNQETAFLVGTDRIAKKTNQVVVYPSVTSPRRGYYEIDIQVIDDLSNPLSDSTRIIDEYARLLESDIQRDPSLWLWSHRRWKVKKETD